MREKYESLALVDLKAIARTRGIKGTSLMKKAMFSFPRNIQMKKA